MSHDHTTTQANVSAALARRLIDAARSHAEGLGKGFTIAIVDASGVLKALDRMDGAALISIQIAQDKAYTAVGFGIPSGAWHDFIKDDPPLAAGAPTGIDRLVVFGGGFPIMVDGVCVGGIGVSGGHYSEDAAVAEAALATLRVTTVDTAQRRLCHALFDALEQGDVAGVDACYAPDMTMWINVTRETITREANLEAVDKGRGMHRRRLYNDRNINTFDDGFVVQYTTHVVAHNGTEVPLSACLVAEVRDGKISKLFEYLDTTQFRSRAKTR